MVLFGILLLPLASASDVKFAELTPLSPQDLALNAGDVSPDGNTVLVVGLYFFVSPRHCLAKLAATLVHGMS